MKKKILISTIIAVCVVSITCVLVIVLCGNKHKHSYSDNWSSDSTKHWHLATCGHNVKSDEAEHTFGDWTIDIEATEESTGSKSRSCTVCEYKETAVIDKLPHTHKYDTTTWLYDETKHWHASTCGHDVISDEAEHDWNESYICNVCGFNYSNRGLHYALSEDGLSYIVDGHLSSLPENVIIPSFYCGKPVTSIGVYAFYNCQSLTSIVIPDSITSIGDEAFYGCQKLTSLVIPNSITSIGVYAFFGCGLTNIVIPDSVTSIGDEAFYGCQKLTSIVIPDSITSIGTYTFFGCGLTSVVIPDSVTSIGDYAFYSCQNLTSIVIPDSITSIGYCVFYGCLKLNAVYYSGTSEEWNNISIGTLNDRLINASRYYYSESQPTDTTYSYWHYVEGNPTIW